MKVSARILIVTNGPLARNPRVVKEATALGQAGHAVTVLGIRNHAPSVALDVALTAGAPFIHRELDLLGGPGLRPDRLRVWLRRLRIRLRRELSLRWGWTGIGTLGPAHALLRTARNQLADLIIVHNEVPHWVGMRLLAEGRRVAADIEDWHSEDLLPQDRAGRPLGLLRGVERELLHRAAYVTTTSEALADGLHARYGGNRPHVITNSFPLQPPPARREPGNPPAFFWFSQTLGRGRGLEPFMAAWALTRHPSRLVLLGEIHGEFDVQLLAHLPERFRDRVRFLPLVAPAALPALIAEHDIGLALEQSSIANRNLTITNKIIQYLNAGLTVVASSTAGQREVLAHDPAAGLIVETGEPNAFARTLDGLLADRDALATRQLAARRLAERIYCWEREAPRLLELVEKTLQTPAGRSV